MRRYWMLHPPGFPPFTNLPAAPLQGWQCPLCEAVYASWVVQCDSCGEGKKPEMANEQ